MFVNTILAKVRDQSRCEQKLWAPKALLPYGDPVATRKQILTLGLLDLVCLLHLGIEVESDLPMFNFDLFAFRNV